jgi:hypothetical protein
MFKIGASNETFSVSAGLICITRVRSKGIDGALVFMGILEGDFYFSCDFLRLLVSAGILCPFFILITWSNTGSYSVSLLSQTEFIWKPVNSDWNFLTSELATCLLLTLSLRYLVNT